MNEIIKFCNLNDSNELIERFEKLNLKRQDVYLVKADGKCYVCFKQKDDFKTRFKKYRIFDSIKKWISKMKTIVPASRLEKWFEKQNENINQLIK